MGRIVDENYEPVYNDALVEETNEIIYKQVYLADNAFDIIPVQRVVRCKDCKNADIFHQCDRVNFWTSIDDFCSRGERKDEVEK